MKNRSTIKLRAIAVIVLLAGPVQAVEILWQYSEQMYQDSDREAFVNTDGSYVLAFSSGNTAGAMNTINGVDFLSVTGTNLYHGVTNNGVVFSLDLALPGHDTAFKTGSFGSGAVGNVIKSSIWGFHTVTIDNLIPGEWYMMQVLVNDARRNASYHTGFSDGENGFAASQTLGTAGDAKLSNGSEASGDSIIGYFQADSSGTVSYEVSGSDNDWSGTSSGRAQLNGFQLRQLAGEPELDLRPAIPSSLIARPTGPTEVTLTWSEANGADSYIVKRSTVSGGPYGIVATDVTATGYTDTVPVTDTTYYYTVGSTNEHGASPSDSSEFAAVVINATIIYSYGSDYGTQYEAYSLFDGNTGTHYDSAVDAWAGLDYGAGNEKQFVRVNYVLRSYADASVLPYATNATFQGANQPDFSDAVTFHTVTNPITAPTVNSFDVMDLATYRYIRVLSASGVKNKAFAELVFFTTDDFTANGTPIFWLEDHGLTEADDEVDNDTDGLLTWEEYVAGTIPTNSSSVLTVNSIENTANGLVISWQSVEGKSYRVMTNLNLTVGTPALEATVTGLDGETSYTGTVSGADAVFYEIGVE